MANFFKTISLTLLLTFNFSFCQTENPDVQLTDVMKELIVTKKNGDTMQQIFWLPVIYWELSLKDSKFGNVAIINEISSTLEGYTLLLVNDITISAFSGMEKNEIKNISIKIKEDTYKPLKDIPEDVSNLLDVLKPTFSKMLGAYGKNIEIFVFDNSHENKISPEKEGGFNVSFNDTQVEFILPLSSLVEKKVCPEDQKLLNGNWIYCPWHGKKLETKQ